VSELFDTMRQLISDAAGYERAQAADFADYVRETYGVELSEEQALCLIVDVHALARRAAREYGPMLVEMTMDARAAVQEAERWLGFAPGGKTPSASAE
jgi:hypothetical protein